MLMQPIAARTSPNAAVVVRLMRRWAALKETDALPGMVAFGAGLGIPAPGTIAVASMFQLTEACLGRSLVPECCCSPRLSGDEQAIMLMLTASPSPGAPGGTRYIPHGLPGALVWAVASVRRLLAIEAEQALPAPAGCPFQAS